MMKTIHSHNTKRGITVGAFGGFIAAIAFIGIMLCLPLILSLPVGIFFHALGLSILRPIGLSDTIRTGLAAFGLVLAQGVLVGIILGIVTTKIKRLYISNTKKGVGLGLATGVITYLVLFVSVILTIYPALLTGALANYPKSTPFSLQGLHTYAITTQPKGSSLILGYGLFAYLVYGFILGGILAWASSIYRFDLSKAAQLEKDR